MTYYLFPTAVIYYLLPMTSHLLPLPMTYYSFPIAYRLLPITYFEGVPSPVIYPESTDMVVFRENSEDIYAGIEFKADSDEAKKVIKFFKSKPLSSIVVGQQVTDFKQNEHDDFINAYFYY